MNTIRQGDCIQEMRQLKGGSVDLVFADPPFNIGYSYDVYHDSLSGEAYLAWSREWMGEVHRILRSNGTFWLAIGDEFAAELKLAAREIGFHCRSWVIWYYTFGVNCSRKFTRSHAHLFYFVKDPDDFIFRADDLENRVPSARQLVYHDHRAHARGRLPDDTWIIPPAEPVGELLDLDQVPIKEIMPASPDSTWTLRPQDLDAGFRPQEDTWYFPRVAGTFKERSGFHGCQMPEQLLGRIIRTCSEPGGLVVDPFSGSGTTVAVARKLGRRYLAFDLSEEYVRLGLARLASIRVGDPLDGAPEPKVSAPRTNAPRLARKKNSVSRQSMLSEECETDALQEASERQRQWTLHGIVEAFAAAHDGYSVDRVVSDPDLNERFTRNCHERGLAGDVRTWNLLLFRLRKAGNLEHLPATRRTAMSWSECDPFLFASEIAWKLLLDEGLASSLDEILCDPVLTERFDGLASEFAPGFKPFQYRWGALKLRKEKKDARVRAALLSPLPRLGKPVALERLVLEETPEMPGVYLLGGVRSRKPKLYVGETMNLRSRFRRQFGDGQRELWCRHAHKAGIAPEELSVWVRPLKVNAGDVLAWQARLVQEYQPRLNLLKG